jgi:hypothetical protein
MKTIFHITFQHANRNSGHAGYAQKEVDLPFAVPIGYEVESVAWKKPRRVVSASLNIDQGGQYIFAHVEPEDVIAEELGLHAFCYEGHGWTVSSGLQGLSDKYAADHGQPLTRRAAPPNT